jgi:hypothetical protein
MILVEKLEGKRTLGRHRHKCEDNIEMDVREIGRVDMDLIIFTQDSDHGGHL